MKIVHVMIAAFYKEGYGYQENIMPAKHLMFGHDVTILTYDRYNVYADYEADDKGLKKYNNDKGVKVIVLPDNDSRLRKMHLWIFALCVNKTKYLYDTLCSESPDVIFVHGILSSDHSKIVKYKKKHPMVRVYLDNHADYYNSPIKTLRQWLTRKVLGRWYVRRMAAVCERVWGVTPWRVDYLREIYGLREPKLGLLVMGGDEQLINWNERKNIRYSFRQQHGIPQEAFVVVAGGKIDKTKNIHLLIDAVKSIDNPLLYLVVFGNFSEDLKKYAEQKHPRIITLGWMKADSVYDIFLSSDLGAFPGTHSVLWEQACASGLPCIFKDWNGGFRHVDLGGNCIFIQEITIASLTEAIKNLLSDKKHYANMQHVAEQKCRKEFAYNEIAKRAIELE